MEQVPPLETYCFQKRRLAQDNQAILIGKGGASILPRKETLSMSGCLRRRGTLVLPWKGIPFMSQRQTDRRRSTVR